MRLKYEVEFVPDEGEYRVYVRARCGSATGEVGHCTIDLTRRPEADIEIGSLLLNDVLYTPAEVIE